MNDARRWTERATGRVVIGAILSLTAASTMMAAKPALRASRSADAKAYIVRTVGRERSAGRDRLTPARFAAAITVIDIDRDGIADYMVDFEKVIHTSWCGTGGCDLELWRGSATGHPIRVWNEMVRERRVRNRGGEIIFDFDFHGSYCGTFGAEACLASFAWDKSAGRMIERPTPGGDTTVRLIDPVPITRAQVPVNIVSVERGANAQCKANGIDEPDGLPVSIPDIDGDGLRDWSLTSAVCDKPGDFELEQRLFATAGDALHPVMAAAGVRFNLSFATRPASVALINASESCGGYTDKICSQTPMTWRAASKKMEVADPR